MVDPVRYGLAVSLARLGRNITGVAHDPGPDSYKKRFQLLKVAVPKATKVGILASQAFIERSGLAKSKATARRAGIELVFPIEAVYWREDEYRAAFAHMAREGVDLVIVTEQNENLDLPQINHCSCEGIWTASNLSGPYVRRTWWVDEFWAVLDRFWQGVRSHRY